MKLNTIILLLLIVLGLVNNKSEKDKEKKEGEEKVDLPDNNAFNINLGLKLIYNEKNIDYLIRIHSDEWYREAFSVIMSPDLMDIITMVTEKSRQNKSPEIANEFGEYDLL